MITCFYTERQCCPGCWKLVAGYWMIDDLQMLSIEYQVSSIEHHLEDATYNSYIAIKSVMKLMLK